MKKPFSEVYFTGIVRDDLGRKMSKQLGNSPDLLKLIETYGADAVRFGIMISSPAGNDLLFDKASLEQGRNFNNKIWNALKLVKIWEGKKVAGYQLPVTSDEQPPTGNLETATGNFALRWFENRLNEVRADVDLLMKQFRLSEALKTIYSLIWDDFCSWYLEWVKPGFEENISENIYNKTLDFFEDLLQLLHPFMPFITEEIYHLLKEQKNDLTVKQFKESGSVDHSILAQGNILKESVTAIRDAKNKNQVKPREKIKLYIQSDNPQMYNSINKILAKQVNATSIGFTKGLPANSLSVIVNKDKLHIETENVVETGSQKEQLLKDLEYLKGFLNSVERKLNNEKFVQNAKAEVIDLERKKKADAEIKIQVIQESLSALN